ncbi:alpha/beta hydrolase [Asticcacaulis sp. YBE204]|uniref:alpha/beta hydrolase n=1 Tax=Asticcacaulis sp. YBE204 TaxID=1282363 RepID=UPI0003C3B398|nr:alpha/beta fold hydrolase [Asticcacaulis sp. YBE204]ESQ79645.1 hypothetical protein AEYBE204_07325 [Asticcacaulis sp. YBE204]
MKRLICAALLAISLTGCAPMVRQHIYYPEPMPAAFDWRGAEPQAISVTTTDGLTIKGYYYPPRDKTQPLVVFFHGNGGNGYYAARMAAPLTQNGSGLLVADYRGYGGNPGKPSETGLRQDAKAFIDLGRTLQPGAPLYLFGHSLGGAVALDAATREDIAGVITLGTFSSLSDMAPAYARAILPDRFDNRRNVTLIETPLLLIHGTADQTVPFSQGEALRDAATKAGVKVRFLKLDGAGHQVDFAKLAPLVWDTLQLTTN